MRKSRIKQKIANGQPALVTTLHLTDPSLYEMVSLLGFDGIWMDMEHHAYSLETANHLMRAARVGKSDIMARPAKGEFMRMSRMLEAGAQGILYPRCDDAKEAAEVVRWAKFAPLGTRGFDGGNPDMPYCFGDIGEYTRQANEETFIALQIEDPNALNHAQAMLEVEGVDLLFMGPGDFSILAGFPGDILNPEVDKALEVLADAARKTGKHWGTVSPNVERTKQLLDMGASLVAHGADITNIRKALLGIQEDFGKLGFTFDNQLEGVNAQSYAEKA